MQAKNVADSALFQYCLSTLGLDRQFRKSEVAATKAVQGSIPSVNASTVSNESSATANKSSATANKPDTNSDLFLPEELDCLHHSIVNFHNYLDFRDWGRREIATATNIASLYRTILSSFTGAQVILPVPHKGQFSGLQASTNVELCHVETTYENQWKLTEEQLQTACQMGMGIRQKRVLLLENPTSSGQVYGAHELLAIARVCRDFDVLVINNESGSLFNFAQNHALFEHYYPSQSITLGCLPTVLQRGRDKLYFARFCASLCALQTETQCLLVDSGNGVGNQLANEATQAYLDLPLAKALLEKKRGLWSFASSMLASNLANTSLLFSQSHGGNSTFVDFSSLSKELKKQGISTSSELVEKVKDITAIDAVSSYELGMPKSSLSLVFKFKELTLEQIQISDENELYQAFLLQEISKLSSWINSMS